MREYRAVWARIDAHLHLAELDPDRAYAMQTDATRIFGEDMLRLADAAVDPCALTYLVGNGAQAGRKGTCHDEITRGEHGPRLVVVPAADGSGRFAMTKQEISWGEFRRFCEETGNDGPCAELERSAEINERLPVTGISLDTARAYARWLTETTGFVYRLPTSAEWLRAARGEPDPNRNCRVQLEGVQRGHSPVAAGVGAGNEFGLVHMLGNVQEWVVDDGGVIAVGGAYSDPIAECVAETARAHAGQPAADTGFRLVREVS